VGLRLYGEVSLDGTGWESTIKKLEGAGDHLGHSLKALALEAFGIYGIEQAFQKTVETAETLVETSCRLVLSLEALQEFLFEAKHIGEDIEALTGFIEKLNSARIDPKKWGSFAKIGIDESARKSEVTELIMKISANVRTRSPQEVIGPLRDVGGRGAGVLLPMLRENLAELREEAHRLGVVMKTEDAVMLKFMADEMKILSQVMVAGLAPAIAFVMVQALKFINSIKATGTFWGDLTQKPGFFEDLKDFFSKGAKLDAQGKSSFQRRWEGAGAASQTELDELNTATDERIKELLKKQKAMEQIGALPDFDSVMNEPKTPKSHLKDYSDSLTKVGNFLGSARDMMPEIGRQQLSVLHKIEGNTRQRAATSGGSTVRFPN
jgi:hypothetical protein